jgi:hypothetical protein
MCVVARSIGSSTHLTISKHTAPPLTNSKDGSALVAGLVQQLSSALVYTDVGNTETNRRLWDRYAESWGPQEEVRV